MSNTNYSKIDNTFLDAGLLMSQLGSSQQITSKIKWIHGSFSPRAAGNYSVVDDNGDQIELSTRAFVTRTFIIGSIDLAGGTTVNVGGGDTAGGPVVTTLSSGTRTTNELTTGWTVITSGAALGPTYYFVNATSVGVYTSGTVHLIFEILEL